MLVIPPQSEAPVQNGRWGRVWSAFMDRLVRTINEFKAPTYTVATAPTNATAGQIIFVSDETGGATLAVYDGSNWVRTSDLSTIST